MTSIGDSLRRAREERGLDIERVADETRIARRFIVALEAEDFSVFPGEPYALGFLRNYAEYLGLDQDDLAASFRTLRIQEQPVPIQELIPAKGPNPLLLAAGGALLLVALAVGAYLLFRGRDSGEPPQSALHAPTEYRMTRADLDRRFWPGDSVIVDTGTDIWMIALAGLEEGATFNTPLGQRRLSLGEETSLDLDRDGQPDLRVLLTDIDKKNASKGANLRFTLLGRALAALASGNSAQEGTGAAALASAPPTQGTALGSSTATTAQPAATANLPPPVPTAETATATAREGVIFDGQKSSYPFVVSVTFRASCMFRYEVDKRDRDERYYQKGDTISISANNSVKIWASNAQSAALVVQASGGKMAEVSLGGAGEVAVKRLAWVQGDNGSYSLSLFEVD